MCIVVDLGSLGIVLGGLGNGEQIVVNKVFGVCCVLVWSVQIVVLVCEYNNVQLIGIGGCMYMVVEVLVIVDVFVIMLWLKV